MNCCYCENKLPVDGPDAYINCEICDDEVCPGCAGIVDDEFICLRCMHRIHEQIVNRLSRESIGTTKTKK